MTEAAAWFLSLGERYGVNPWIFGSIYVGAIPFFTLSLGWLVRSMKRRQPLALPALASGFFFVSAYLYLIAVGRNVPVWVYFFLAGMVGIGVASTVRKVRRQVAEGDS